MLDLRDRLTGLAMLLASGGSTFLHRTVYEAAKAGPAQVTELVLGLSTFLLASTGILLLIHGLCLFERSNSERSSGSPAFLREDTGDFDPETREGMATLNDDTWTRPSP